MFDSALDAVNKGLDLGGIVREAQPFKHSKILHFTQVRWRSCDCHLTVTWLVCLLQLREDVYGELANVDQVAGVKVCV